MEKKLSLLRIRIIFQFRDNCQKRNVFSERLFLRGTTKRNWRKARGRRENWREIRDRWRLEEKKGKEKDRDMKWNTTNIGGGCAGQ